MFFYIFKLEILILTPLIGCQMIIFLTTHFDVVLRCRHSWSNQESIVLVIRSNKVTISVELVVKRCIKKNIYDVVNYYLAHSISHFISIRSIICSPDGYSQEVGGHFPIYSFSSTKLLQNCNGLFCLFRISLLKVGILTDLPTPVNDLSPLSV